MALTRRRKIQNSRRKDSIVAAKRATVWKSPLVYFILQVWAHVWAVWPRGTHRAGQSVCVCFPVELMTLSAVFTLSHVDSQRRPGRKVFPPGLLTHTHTHTPFRRDAAPSAAPASRGKWEWDQRRRLRTCRHLGGMNRTMPCMCARVSQVTWWSPRAAPQPLRHQSVTVAADDNGRNSWKHFLTSHIKSHKTHVTLCRPCSKMSTASQRLGHIIKFQKNPLCWVTKWMPNLKLLLQLFFKYMFSHIH